MYSVPVATTPVAGNELELANVIDVSVLDAYVPIPTFARKPTSFQRSGVSQIPLFPMNCKKLNKVLASREFPLTYLQN